MRIQRHTLYFHGFTLCFHNLEFPFHINDFVYKVCLIWPSGSREEVKQCEKLPNRRKGRKTADRWTDNRYQKDHLNFRFM